MTAEQFQTAPASEKLDFILSKIESGSTFCICTAYRVTTITQKNVQTWRKAGRELLIAKGNSLYVGRGKGYDCIDFCGLRFAR